MKYSFMSGLLVAFFSVHSLAALKIPTAQNYENGRFLCENKYKHLLPHEKGFYVTVPVSYQDPSQGTTEVYAYFPKGYSADRPTLLYFTGGPGQGVHWGAFRNEVPFNVLLMEHRGIGCSRPAKIEQYLDPSFYSSENVARDAEQVRLSLKIGQVTVYGISYGTIPATIYASLFPQATKAAIFEGTVFTGDSNLWESPHRRKILQRLLDSLPAPIKARIELVHTREGVPNIWFAAMARQFMGSNEGLAKFKETLLSLEDDAFFTKFVTDLKKNFTPFEGELHPLFATDEIVYSMISCQELFRAEPTVSAVEGLVQGRLVSQSSAQHNAACHSLKASTQKIYAATRYPVKVPVTYFQGADDGATASPEAIKHYKQVPQGPKQLLILVRGGHNPNLFNLEMDEAGQLEMFNHALLGEPMPAPLLQKVRQQQRLYWAYTSKNF